MSNAGVDRQHTITCPGCGAVLPASDAVEDGRFTAADECQQLCGALLDDPLFRLDIGFPYQTVVDAYAAQHASPASRSIGIAFALIGLSLKFERGFTGREVQRAHTILARLTRDWPSFPLPAARGDVTVLDVVRCAPGPTRMAMLDTWARSVWQSWAETHDRVASLVETYLSRGRR